MEVSDSQVQNRQLSLHSEVSYRQRNANCFHTKFGGRKPLNFSKGNAFEEGFYLKHVGSFNSMPGLLEKKKQTNHYWNLPKVPGPELFLRKSEQSPRALSNEKNSLT